MATAVPRRVFLSHTSDIGKHTDAADIEDVQPV